MLEQFLQPEGQASRRTLADALEVLRVELGFLDLDRAAIQIVPLRPFAAASVAVVFQDKFVLLPAAETFLAKRDGEQGRMRFAILTLHNSMVEGSGIVRCADGSVLKAVEITPALLPYTATPLDGQILKLVLASLNREETVERSIRHGVPNAFSETLPDRRAVDFNRLRNVRALSYKVFERWRRANEPRLRVSRQKYEDVITKVGMHVPIRRDRLRRNHIR